jgi:hypothetical protein
VDQDELALGPAVRVAGVDARGADDVLAVLRGSVIALAGGVSQHYSTYIGPTCRQDESPTKPLRCESDLEKLLEASASAYTRCCNSRGPLRSAP